MSAAIPQAMTLEDVLQRAIAHREAGRYKEAALVLQSWLASHPQDASAHALLAQVLSLNKQDDLAWVDMNTALSIDPALPIVQRNHARLLLRQQKTHAALQVAQAAYRSDVTDPENHLVLAAALAANHQNEPAYQLVESALQSRPNYAEAYATRAQFKLRSGDPGGALLDAEKCLAIKPHLAQMWGMAGALRHRFKNLPGAIGALEKALDYEPDNADFLMNLGEFKRQAGALDAAIVLLEKAVAIAPANAGAWVNLGAALQESRRIPEAKAAYAKALEIAPKQAEVASNLGVLAKEEENWEEALRYFDQALAYQPARVAIMVNRAVALNALERHADAEQAAHQVILLEPSHTEAYLALSSALIGQKHYEAAQAVLDTLKLPNPADTENARHLALSYVALFRAINHWTEAEAWVRRVLAVKPKEVKVLRQLGVILDEQKRHEDAQAVFREALEYAPEDADTLQAMARHHARQERWQEAEAWVRRVLAVKPDFAEAHSNLGITLIKLGHPDEAEASCRRALALKPDFAEAHNSLGNILNNLGRLNEADASYRRALQIKPDFAKAHSNLLFCLAHNPTLDADTLFSEHRRFGERFEAPFLADRLQHTNSRNPERPLQIGFVSADLRNHAVANFIEPVLVHLAGHPQLSLHAYYNYAVEDSASLRLKGHLKHWHSIVGLSDEVLAKKIREDGIDILIDLSGHTAKHRLLTFARKPAPVQASMIGYPGTTGLKAVDYYLSDRFFLPPGQFDSQFTEKIVRMPASVPFLPFEDAPPVNALPALDNGYVTFGSFNRPSKLSRAVIALWAQLLRALPDSRMVLGAMPQEGKNDLLINWFAQESIARERLDFYKRSGMASYLGLHHQVDICLDTFPYNGGTTTLHALWMGVPTLTLAGGTIPGRTGAGVLGHVGLEAFIAHDAADFIQKGLTWAGNLAALSDIRAGLRERFAKSAMGQPAVVAAGVERALCIMWQRWCAGLPPESFEVTLQDVNHMMQETSK